MATKKKKITVDHEHWGIQITRYDISVGASVHHEATQTRRQTNQTPAYDMSAKVEVEGTCLYPDERAGAAFQLSIYADEARQDEFQRTLSEYRVLDTHGMPKTRKQGDYRIYLYDPPKGIGYIDKTRGQYGWHGACWVSTGVMGYLISLAGIESCLYMTLHERIEGRNHQIQGMTVQTEEPT